MLSKEEVLHLLNEAKKEVDRLETNRQEDLGNSINYIKMNYSSNVSYLKWKLMKKYLVN